MAKRGRPVLAAQTLDEALHAVYTGTAPKHPRNAHERAAVRRPRGRPIDTLGPIERAAQLTLYLQEREGLPLAKALDAALIAMATEVWDTRTVGGAVQCRKRRGPLEIDPGNVRKRIREITGARKVLATVEDAPQQQYRLIFIPTWK